MRKHKTQAHIEDFQIRGTPDTSKPLVCQIHQHTGNNVICLKKKWVEAEQESVLVSEFGSLQWYCESSTNVYLHWTLQCK